VFCDGIEKIKKSIMMNQHNDYWGFVLLFLSKLKCIPQYLFVCVMMLRERNSMKKLSVYLLAK